MGLTARVVSSLPERDQLVTDHIGLVRIMAQRLAQRLPHAGRTERPDQRGHPGTD